MARVLEVGVMGARGPKPGDGGYRHPADHRERIVNFVVLDEAGCWNWDGARSSKGYGRTFFGSRIDGSRRALSTHRVAYEAWIGPIPDGLQLDHLCENKACCNPWHLEPVTNAENKRRWYARSRAVSA
jgi:hypothetical protein